MKQWIVTSCRFRNLVFTLFQKLTPNTRAYTGPQKWKMQIVKISYEHSFVNILKDMLCDYTKSYTVQFKWVDFLVYEIYLIKEVKKTYSPVRVWFLYPGFCSTIGLYLRSASALLIQWLSPIKHFLYFAIPAVHKLTILLGRIW